MEHDGGQGSEMKLVPCYWSQCGIGSGVHPWNTRLEQTVANKIVYLWEKKEKNI